jgi:hypothetical protein
LVECHVESFDTNNNIRMTDSKQETQEIMEEYNLLYSSDNKPTNFCYKEIVHYENGLARKYLYSIDGSKVIPQEEFEILHFYSAYGELITFLNGVEVIKFGSAFKDQLKVVSFGKEPSSLNFFSAKKPSCSFTPSTFDKQYNMFGVPIAMFLAGLVAQNCSKFF